MGRGFLDADRPAAVRPCLRPSQKALNIPLTGPGAGRPVNRPLALLWQGTGGHGRKDGIIRLRLLLRRFGDALFRLLRTRAFLLALVAILPCLGFVLGLDAAYRYGRLEGTPLPYRFDIAEDGSLGEWLEYALTAASAAALLVAWRAARAPVYLAAATAFIFLTLDNSLALHEAAGAALAPFLAGWAGEAGAQAIGELLAFGLIGLALAAGLAASARASAPGAVTSTACVLAAVAGAMAFGIGLDFAGQLLAGDSLAGTPPTSPARAACRRELGVRRTTGADGLLDGLLVHLGGPLADDHEAHAELAAFGGDGAHDGAGGGGAHALLGAEVVRLLRHEHEGRDLAELAGLEEAARGDGDDAVAADLHRRSRPRCNPQQAGFMTGRSKHDWAAIRRACIPASPCSVVSVVNELPSNRLMPPLMNDCAAMS